MRTNSRGIALIKKFEGCKLQAYQDIGGVWTIGYGSTRDVGPGETIDQEEAEHRFFEDLEEVESLLNQCVPKTLSECAFSALASFCFNVGFGKKDVKDGFLILKNGRTSTMMKCILAGDMEGAAAEFPKWDKVSGIPCLGLLSRRMAEQDLFLYREAKNAD